ncbi:MAG: hypothetical protein KF826_09415 [Xanthobacteraceae bacterium]|nr:hypothetical protein [Xanthobacteraceae bacterium]
MKVTPDGITLFFIGAAMGSVVTYFLLTQEKRIIARVRNEICSLGIHHDVSYRAVVSPDATLSWVTDERVLEVYYWSKMIFDKKPKRVPKFKFNRYHLAAEVIICEKFLSLGSMEAFHALQSANLDWETLRGLKRKVER